MVPWIWSDKKDLSEYYKLYLDSVFKLSWFFISIF